MKKQNKIKKNKHSWKHLSKSIKKSKKLKSSLDSIIEVFRKLWANTIQNMDGQRPKKQILTWTMTWMSMLAHLQPYRHPLCHDLINYKTGQSGPESADYISYAVCSS